MVKPEGHQVVVCILKILHQTVSRTSPGGKNHYRHLHKLFKYSNALLVLGNKLSNDENICNNALKSVIATDPIWKRVVGAKNAGRGKKKHLREMIGVPEVRRSLAGPKEAFGKTIY